MSKLNPKIIAYFKENKIRQEDIANALNVDQSFISKVLSGKKEIGLNFAKKLSKAYNIPLIDLLVINEINTFEETKNQIFTNKTEKITTTMESEERESERIREINEQIKLYKELIKAKDETIKSKDSEIDSLKREINNMIQITIKALNEEISALKQRNSCYDFVDEKNLSANKG